MFSLLRHRNSEKKSKNAKTTYFCNVPIFLQKPTRQEKQGEQETNDRQNKVYCGNKNQKFKKRNFWLKKYFYEIFFLNLNKPPPFQIFFPIFLQIKRNFLQPKTFFRVSYKNHHCFRNLWRRKLQGN